MPTLARSIPRRRRIHGGHVLAAMFGGLGLLLSFKSLQTTHWSAYAIPVGSAVLVGWLLWQVLPPWVPALLVGGMGLYAAVHVNGIKTRQRSDQQALLRDYAIKDVCNGTPLGRDPGGLKLRSLDGREGSTYWNDAGGDWSFGKVPAFVLCTRHRSEDVHCGDYREIGKAQRESSRICTKRQLATAELRRTKTAEVVFRKEYRGDDPPPLTSSVTRGGAYSTKLSGPFVPLDTIHADIKPILAQP